MRPFMRSVLAKVYVKHPHPIVYPILYIPGLIKYRWTNDRVIRSHCIEASLYIYALNIEDSTQYTHNNGKEQICNGSSCDRESGTGTAALDNIGWNKFRATHRCNAKYTVTSPHVHSASFACLPTLESSRNVLLSPIDP